MLRPDSWREPNRPVVRLLVSFQSHGPSTRRYPISIPRSSPPVSQKWVGQNAAPRRPNQLYGKIAARFCDAAPQKKKRSPHCKEIDGDQVRQMSLNGADLPIFPCFPGPVQCVVGHFEAFAPLAPRWQKQLRALTPTLFQDRLLQFDQVRFNLFG
jgi:hypothetical protein